MPIGRPPNRPEDVWKKVDQRSADECWPWTGTKKPQGYGIFGFQGQTMYSHRLVYELVHGEIPAGHHVMHACNNKLCCNPHHLRTGTPAQNTKDAYRDGLAPTGEYHPKAKLTKEDVVAIKAKYALGVTQVAPSKEYGVTQSSIWAVLKDRSHTRHTKGKGGTDAKAA